MARVRKMNYFFLHVLVVVAVVFVSVAGDFFFNISSKIGPFIWCGVIPIVIISASLLIFGQAETLRELHEIAARKQKR